MGALTFLVFVTKRRGEILERVPIIGGGLIQESFEKLEIFNDFVDLGNDSRYVLLWNIIWKSSERCRCR